MALEGWEKGEGLEKAEKILNGVKWRTGEGLEGCTRGPKNPIRNPIGRGRLTAQLVEHMILYLGGRDLESPTMGVKVTLKKRKKRKNPLGEKKHHARTVGSRYKLTLPPFLPPG